MRTCPGCGAVLSQDNLCCDSCWDRVPTDLPDIPRWRSQLRGARKSRNWGLAEDIHVIVVKWLVEAHPIPSTGQETKS